MIKITYVAICDVFQEDRCIGALASCLLRMSNTSEQLVPSDLKTAHFSLQITAVYLAIPVVSEMQVPSRNRFPGPDMH